MRWEDASTLLQAPETVRELLYHSGVYMVNDCFTPLYTQKAFIKDLWGGRGAGRSHHATDYADHLLRTLPYCRIAFLRYSLGSVRDSLWQDFMDRIDSRDSRNDYNIAENTMRLSYKKNGNKIIGKGVKAEGKQTAKMKSLAGFTHVIIEEADEIPYPDFRKLLLSIRKKGVDIEIIRLFNPPRKEHWIWEDYILSPSDHDGYFTAIPKPGTGILSMNSNHISNIHNLNDEYLKEIRKGEAKLTDEYLIDCLGLINSGKKGMVYSGWERISDKEFNELPYNSYYGLDFGWSVSQMALCEIKMHNGRIYARQLIYQTGLELIDLAIKLIQLGLTGDDLIVADNAEKNNINKLRNGWTHEEILPEIMAKYPALEEGFYIIPCQKGLVRERSTMIGQYQVFIAESSHDFWNEYLSYSWELDKNGIATDEPVDSNNHLMDAFAYIVMAKGRLY